MAPATAFDPTLESLHRLDDPALWEVVRNVPVFDEHDEEYEVEETGPDGKPRKVKRVRKFDRKKLEEIADNCNRREVETGDATPIAVGHTRENAPETAQPPIVGYARNHKVGRFGPKGKLAVLVDYYLRKDQTAVVDANGRPLSPAEILREYPRRSVEYWESDNIFDPISLLSRTPQRDLGLIAYERRCQRKLYSMEATVPEEKIPGEIERTNDPREEEIADKYARRIAGHLFGHPLMRHLAKKYGKECGVDPEHPEKHFEDMKPEGEKPSQYAAAGPSGTDTFVPGTGGKPEPSNLAPGSPSEATRQMEEVSRMSREQDAIRYSRIEQSNAQLRKEIEDLKAANAENAKQYRRTAREKDLIQLEAEGFVIERAAELDDVQEMPVEKYAKHLTKIRKSYRRMPIAGHGPLGEIRTAMPQGDDAPAAKKYSKETVARAIQIHGDYPDKPYEECLELAAKAA